MLRTCSTYCNIKTFCHRVHGCCFSISLKKHPLLPQKSINRQSSIIPKVLHFHLCINNNLIRKTSGQSLGTLQQSSALWIAETHNSSFTLLSLLTELRSFSAEQFQIWHYVLHTLLLQVITVTKMTKIICMFLVILCAFVGSRNYLKNLKFRLLHFYYISNINIFKE